MLVDLGLELVQAVLDFAALGAQLALALFPVIESALTQLAQPDDGFGVVLDGDLCIERCIFKSWQLLALGVEIGLELGEGAVVGDGAAVDALVGRFDPALGGLTVSSSFAQGVARASVERFLFPELCFQRLDEGGRHDLVIDRAMLTERLVAADVDFLKLLHPLKIHIDARFRWAGGGAVLSVCLRSVSANGPKFSLTIRGGLCEPEAALHIALR